MSRRYLSFTVPIRYSSSRLIQSAQSIRELLLGPRAVEANIFYLQNEEHKFTVREGGKEWSVYGSPVIFYCGYDAP
jgi:hypothetical protein